MALILPWPAVSLGAVQDEKFFLLFDKGELRGGLPQIKKKPAESPAGCSPCAGGASWCLCHDRLREEGLAE